MIAEGPCANLPPHIALEPALLSSRSFTIPALAFTLLVAGCDRQSSAPAQGEPGAKSAPGAAAKAGTVDRSHKGSLLPDFTLRDPAGRELQLKSLHGAPVLINLWATWCAPCVAELPALDRLAQRGGVKVLTISQDMGQPDKVSSFLKQRGVTRLEAWLDPANDLAFHYGAQILPTSILYDANGREVWRVTGPLEWDGTEAARLLAERW
jgi:thiol-disulfide isomerase/thioredoxin